MVIAIKNHAKTDIKKSHYCPIDFFLLVSYNLWLIAAIHQKHNRISHIKQMIDFVYIVG